MNHIDIDEESELNQNLCTSDLGDRASDPEVTHRPDHS